MVFSSMFFVFAFFAVTIPAHRLCRGVRAKNVCLLLASLVFYSWASLRFTAVLIFDTAVCWAGALAVERREGAARKRALWLCVGVLLAVLGLFKYAGPALRCLQRLTGLPERVPEVAMPLGISFYTFQLISYAADVYRGRVRAQRRFWMLLLYASLFIQCVAGPIVRYSDLEGELEDRQVTAGRTSRGISRFTVGLAKKAVLANSCGLAADAFLSGDAAALAAQPALGLWLSGAAYMLQIYLDFSAYSDMAVGMGLMCGFHLPENFDYPYLAESVTDFWRSWHMTLGGFFRDYVYIPLGGSRRGPGRQVLNLLVVWCLTGLWHGASANFLLWGMYFFVLQAAEKLLTERRLRRVPGFLRHLGLLIAVYFSWIIFRFGDLASIKAVLTGMFRPGGAVAAARLTLKSNWALLAVSAVACTPVGRNLRLRLRDRAGKSAAAMAAYRVWETVHPVVLLAVSAMALAGSGYDPFLYWMY